MIEDRGLSRNMGSALKKAIGGLKIDSILQFELDFEIVWYKLKMKNFIRHYIHIYISLRHVSSMSS